MIQLTDKKSSPKLTRPTYDTLANGTASILRSAIQQGKYPPGSQLPTELDLIDMLGVSRTTVREALRSLEQQGLIIRRRGLGTFVPETPIVKDLSFNFGLTEMISQAGFTPGSENDIMRIEKASTSVALALNIEEGKEVLVIDRVRTANGVPVVWSIDILPDRVFGGKYPENIEFISQSVYQYLQDVLNVNIAYGEATIHSVPATKEIAAKLRTRSHEPLLLIVQTDFNDEDLPIIYSIEYHLPDKITFKLRRKGSH
jgi:GntR family transcriptional regulator